MYCDWEAPKIMYLWNWRVQTTTNRLLLRADWWFTWKPIELAKSTSDTSPDNFGIDLSHIPSWALKNHAITSKIVTKAAKLAHTCLRQIWSTFPSSSVLFYCFSTSFSIFSSVTPSFLQLARRIQTLDWFHYTPECDLVTWSQDRSSLRCYSNNNNYRKRFRLFSGCKTRITNLQLPVYR